jgi:hypothetical protein
MERSNKRWSALAIVGVGFLLGGLLLSANETGAQTTLQFVQSPQDLGVDPCNDIALGDVDGDGDLDLVIAYGSSSSSVSGVWINQGGAQGGTPGTFARDPNTVLGTFVVSLALGDLDGDHDLDLLLSRASGGSVLETWINEGGKQGGKAGEFKLASTVSSSGGSGSAVVLGDLDGDGDLDAFETGIFRPDRVWMNDGSGVFTKSGPDLPNGNGLRLALGTWMVTATWMPTSPAPPTTRCGSTRAEGKAARRARSPTAGSSWIRRTRAAWPWGM